MVFPILIPSKKRPKSKLFQLLKDDELEFLVVVEPQDYDDYKYLGKNLILLPEDNKGLVFSRNFILEKSKELNFNWFWMIDDDVNKFYKTVNKRNISITPKEAFELSEKIILKSDNIAQAAMEYQQFSWSQSKTFNYNSYCDVVVFINTEKTKNIKYRVNVTLKEDRDFTLQCLSRGYRTMRTTHVAFSCPKNGSNEGGLYDVYKSGVERNSVNEMCKIWGKDICQPVTKKDGRYDVKINWKYFKS